MWTTLEKNMIIEDIKKAVIASITLVLLTNSVAWAKDQPAANQKNANLEESIRSRVASRKAAMKKYVLKIVDLQKEVNKNSAIFFMSSRLNKDAGPFLNPRVEWAGVDSDVTAKAAYEKYMASLLVQVVKLSLPEQATEKLKSLGSAYYKSPNEFDLKSVDFRWLKDLQKYDFWNIENNSPLANLDEFNFATSPIAKFLPLITWAKLRLVKGVQENNVKAAIDETIHLARLVHSTELLIGSMVSNSILRSVAEFAKDRGSPLKVEPAIFDAAKLYFPSLSKALSNPIIDARDYAAISRAGTVSGPGYCAALNEAGFGLHVKRPLLGAEFKEVYAIYDGLLKSHKTCRLINLRRAWADDQKYVAPYKSFDSASARARTQATDILKPNISDEDYKNLLAEVPNARWPQYFGYLQDLQSTPESIFSDLGAK
jgi:hypothetical protein